MDTGRKLWALAATACSVVLCGCVGASSSEEDDPDALPEESAGSSDDLAAEFRERYLNARLGLASPDDTYRVEVVLHDTAEGLIAQCMSDAGYEYWPVPADDAFSHPSDLENPEWVAEYGFGIVDIGDEDSDEDSRNIPYYTTLNRSSQRRYDQALWGPDGDGGCTVAGQEAAAAQLDISDIDGTFAEMPSPLNSPDGQLIERRWSECAAAVGVTSPSLLALTARLAEEYQQLTRAGGDIDELQRREISLATLTIDCTRQRNVDLDELTRSLYEKAVAEGRADQPAD